MIRLHTIFLAILYFVPAVSPSRCNNSIEARKTINASISKISYSTTGGRSGNYESLDFSADSLTYVQARRGTEKMLKEATVKTDWIRLVKAINLTDFDNIKSNPGHALYDGIDITLSIESGKDKHVVVNAHEDTINYKRITPFADLLETKLAEVREKIVW